MKLKHLKSINELYTDTYQSARDKRFSKYKESDILFRSKKDKEKDKEKYIKLDKQYLDNYIKAFLNEGGDLDDILFDIINEKDIIDDSIDLSDDNFIFTKNIKEILSKLLNMRIEGFSKNPKQDNDIRTRYLSQFTRNKSVINSITDLNIINHDIHSLEGIENLINLTRLNCSKNLLTDLKGIENLIRLEYLNCGNNQLTDLKGIENLTNLTEFYCYNNPLEIPYSGDIKTEQERLKKL